MPACQAEVRRKPALDKRPAVAESPFAPMKCFYHSDRDAVAVCKSCSRGICRECCADVPPGVACRGKCEADVAALNLVIQRNKTAYQKAGAAYRRNAVATLIVGLLFLGFGMLPVLVSQDYGAIFLAPLGCVFLLWSYFSYRSGKQICEVGYRSEPATPPNGGPATRLGNSGATEGPPSLS
jgi:hypothetical protein